MFGILVWPVYAIVDARFYKKRSFKSLFVPDFEAFSPMSDAAKLIVAISRSQEEKKFQEIDKKANQNLGFQSGNELNFSNL